jgi:hypothetical protein
MALMGAVYNDQDGKYLLHFISKMVLFKKKEEAACWTELRPISIMPAWLITLEKLAGSFENRF